MAFKYISRNQRCMNGSQKPKHSYYNVLIQGRVSFSNHQKSIAELQNCVEKCVLSLKSYKVSLLKKFKENRLVCIRVY